MKSIRRLLALVLTVALIVSAINLSLYFWQRNSELARLRRERSELQAVIARLTGHTRRAELVVSHQDHNADGAVTDTTMLWQEFTIGPDGKRKPLPIVSINIPGDIAHVDALVVKFADRYVEQGDLLRGKSLIFFRRVYGDTQAPSEGISLLNRRGMPRFLRADPDRVNRFEQQIWRHLWHLMIHPRQAQKLGIAVVQGEDAYRIVQPGKLYVIDARNDGGIEFRQKSGESALVEQMLQRAATGYNSTHAP